MPEVYADERFTVEALPDLGSFGNVSYIVRPRDGGPATVIDAPEGVEAVLAALAGREIGAVIVTHYHSDHWRGFDVLRAVSAAPVYAGAELRGYFGRDLGRKIGDVIDRIAVRDQDEPLRLDGA